MLSAVRLVIATFCVAPLVAQSRGDYFNVETPQVKPITVARIAEHDYLLICNTPDNSVEVWDTQESNGAPQFLMRIPVGLEPCSVLWNPTTNAFYTADFLSDSITGISLTPSTGASPLQWQILARRNLGTTPGIAPLPTSRTVADEPMDIALLSGGGTLVVTSHTGSSIHFVSAADLSPVAVPGTTNGALVLQHTVGGEFHGVKEPRRVVVRGDDVYVLAAKGGTRAPIGPGRMHDVDLFRWNTVSGMTQIWGGLGTTNTGLAMAANGDIYVTGGFARIDLVGTSVGSEPTGFVTSVVGVVRSTGGTQPLRDLNKVGSTPVTTGQLALPQDMVAYERAGLPTKLFVAAMGTDRIGVLDDTSASPVSWPRRVVDIPVLPGVSLHGPRGLALKPASNLPGDPGARLYVLNRVSHTVTLVNPDTEQWLRTFGLNRDPQPAHILKGRSFLYDAKLSQRSVSACASCHPDGRTDGLAWQLGHASAYVDPFPKQFVDSALIAQSLLNQYFATGFPREKGRIVTQSLQGLLNYDVDGATTPEVTNAPYHWRGDRKDFLSFNEAFVGLFGLPNGTGPLFTRPDTDRANLPMGIPSADMELFRSFIESINYPPNPNQQLNRRYSGTFGTQSLANDLTVGTGAMLGMKMFHGQPINGLGNRSCVQCHQLPEGSNNLFTFQESGNLIQPLESAALRGLLQRERKLTAAGGDLGSVFVGNYGVLVGGTMDSVNAFEHRFNLNPFPAPPNYQDIARMDFTREFDWCVAPMVGQAETLTAANANSLAMRAADMELQAQKANAGLVANLFRAGLPHQGFWFHPMIGQYQSEPAGQSLTRAGLVALLGANDRLVLQAVPLGSERRLAHPNGTPAVLGAASVSGVMLVGLVTNSANTEIPWMTKNWVPGASPNDFVWTSTVHPTPPSLKRIRQLQWVQQHYAAGQFGLATRRHDAPRRVRVAGVGLQVGCSLELGIDPAQMPTSGAPPSLATRTLSLPLYPTNLIHNGVAVWETAVELDTERYLRLMAGGASAPGVASILDGAIDAEMPTAVNQFAPQAWNLHHVRIRQPGGQATDCGWQALRIQ